MTVIYHNPRCSKSRKALAILKEKGLDVDIREYLKSPLSVEELKKICRMLGVSPRALVRDTDKTFQELSSNPDDADDGAWFDVLRENPGLLQRPIVVHRQKAVLGRPPENVLEIL